MKAIAVLLLSLLALGADAAGSPGRRIRTWNPSTDFGPSDNQISFHQGMRGVWYFMEGHSLVRDPRLYRFIHDYTAPAVSLPGVPVPVGYSCWQDPSVLVPAVCFNFNTVSVFIDATEIAARSVLMHPGQEKLAILAWKSPHEGMVALRGAFQDVDPLCGNGGAWFVDKDSVPLASGDVPSGGRQEFDLSVHAAKGEVLYFILDPKDGDYYCDSTRLELTIEAVGRFR